MNIPDIAQVNAIYERHRKAVEASQASQRLCDQMEGTEQYTDAVRAFGESLQELSEASAALVSMQNHVQDLLKEHGLSVTTP